jgi:hypothetical protein
MESPPERRTEAQASKSQPDAPGLWTRTDANGERRTHRVISQNGELYAKVGRFLPVAVPVSELPGSWERVD